MELYVCTREYCWGITELFYMRSCGGCGDGEVSPDIMYTAHTREQINIISLFVSIFKMVSWIPLHQMYINLNPSKFKVTGRDLHIIKLKQVESQKLVPT